MYEEELDDHIECVSLSLSVPPPHVPAAATGNLHIKGIVHQVEPSLCSLLSIPTVPIPMNCVSKVGKSKMEWALHTFTALQSGHRKPTVIESLCLIIIQAGGLIAPLFCRSFNIVPSQTRNKEPRQLKLMAIFNNMILPPRCVAAPRERVKLGSKVTLAALFSIFHDETRLLSRVHSYFVKDDYFPFCFMSLC